jgi:outer membrane lipoprotein-sorting protein
MFNSSRARAGHHALILVWLLLPGLTQGRGGTTAFADDLFTQIFNRTLVKQRSMQSMRARFTETTTSSLLTKPLVAHGTIIGASPARVLMTYTDPDVKTIVIDSQTLTIVWPGRNEREKIDITATQKRIEQNFTHATLDDLRAMFQITAAPDASVRGADRIEMTPQRKPMKSGLARLDLWIDRDSDLLVRMRLTFPGGDQKTITLEDIAVNVPVTDEMFKIR